MKNKTLLTVAAFVIALVFAAPAHAQRHMGICTEFNPDGLQGCIPENTFTGTLNTLTDPSFSIAVNNGIEIDNVVLLVLLPDATLPTLMADFSSGDVSFDGSLSFSSGSLIASVDAANIISDGGIVNSTITSGVDWTFNNIANVSLVSVTSYTVYVFETGLGILGPTVTGGPTTVSVDINGTLPAGTIFLAFGMDTTTSWDVTTSMPLTRGVQLVPEPGTLTLFGSGLIALGFLRRKQFFG